MTRLDMTICTRMPLTMAIDAMTAIGAPDRPVTAAKRSESGALLAMKAGPVRIGRGDHRNHRVDRHRNHQRQDDRHGNDPCRITGLLRHVLDVLETDEGEEGHEGPGENPTPRHPFGWQREQTR